MPEISMSIPRASGCNRVVHARVVDLRSSVYVGAAAAPEPGLPAARASDRLAGESTTTTAWCRRGSSKLFSARNAYIYMLEVFAQLAFIDNTAGQAVRKDLAFELYDHQYDLSAALCATA